MEEWKREKKEVLKRAKILKSSKFPLSSLSLLGVIIDRGLAISKKKVSPCAFCGPWSLSFMFCLITSSPSPNSKILFLIMKKNILILIPVKFELFLSLTDGPFTYRS